MAKSEIETSLDSTVTVLPENVPLITVLDVPLPTMAISLSTKTNSLKVPSHT